MALMIYDFLIRRDHSCDYIRHIFSSDEDRRSPTPEQDHIQDVAAVTSEASGVSTENEVQKSETRSQNKVTEGETPKLIQSHIPIESNINSDFEKTNVRQEMKTASVTPLRQIEQKLGVTPKKSMSPKQLQKKLESEKKRQEKQFEREEREKQKQEERERIRQEKETQKQEKERQRLEKEEEKSKKHEQKAKERELKEGQKRKEREEKDAKRKEREEREEAKRRDREQEKLRKQHEVEEKNREKQKLEEQKQKAAAAFANFFVAKKPEVKSEDIKSLLFMPFEVKSDMRLAPIQRRFLTKEEKEILVDYLSGCDLQKSYLDELKSGKKLGKWGKTWPYEEDVIIIDEDFGQSICEDKPKMMKMQVKFLKFQENRRPAYYGTWRKRSTLIRPRRPFEEDKSFFEYDIDSDDDWEEVEQGESLNGSDDEEKENEPEDDYEVDNDFFVPHGHLSDDEVDDEAVSKLSPESHKQKLRLLKDEFDQDMRAKTHKMKPRSIGCIWYNKDESNVDEAIDRYLRPFVMLTNGPIVIKKRKDLKQITPAKKYAKDLREDLLLEFLKQIHLNVNKRNAIVDHFIEYMENNGLIIEVSKTYLRKRLKQYAQWKKCTEEGPMLNKFCWCVGDEYKKKFNWV